MKKKKSDSLEAIEKIYESPRGRILLHSIMYDFEPTGFLKFKKDILEYSEVKDGYYIFNIPLLREKGVKIPKNIKEYKYNQISLDNEIADISISHDGIDLFAMVIQELQKRKWK